MNPLGFRFAISTKGLFSRSNGAVIPVTELSKAHTAISDAGNYFGWDDAAHDDARTLAEKFIFRFPEISHAGKGRDWEYAGWLSELVGFLEQGDFVPALWWENMKGESEDHKTLPIWVFGNENFVWDGISSVMSPKNPTFPLPPGQCGTLLPESVSKRLKNEAEEVTAGIGVLMPAPIYLLEK